MTTQACAICYAYLAMSSTANSTSPLPDDYVVELLSEHGKRRCLIGWADNVHAARECYEAAMVQYPHTMIRLRQGKQPLALKLRIDMSTRRGVPVSHAVMTGR